MLLDNACLEGAQLEGDVDFSRLVDLCVPLFHERSVWTQIKARITDPSPQARQDFSGEMRRSDDKTILFLTRPLPDGATLIAFLDITASKNVEEALRDRAAAFEAADNLKTDFVQNISYQLRTPLQTIQGYAEVLGQEISKQQQSSDWGAPTLSDAQVSYAASDVIYLHALREKLSAMLAREGREDLAEACFRFLPVRVRLDLASFAADDIFAHS